MGMVSGSVTISWYNHKGFFRFNHMPDVSAQVCANVRAASIKAGLGAGNPHHGHYNVFTTLRPTGI